MVLLKGVLLLLGHALGQSLRMAWVVCFYRIKSSLCHLFISWHLDSIQWSLLGRVRSLGLHLGIGFSWGSFFLSLLLLRSSFDWSSLWFHFNWGLLSLNLGWFDLYWSLFGFWLCFHRGLFGLWLCLRFHLSWSWSWFGLYLGWFSLRFDFNRCLLNLCLNHSWLLSIYFRLHWL